MNTIPNDIIGEILLYLDNTTLAKFSRSSKQYAKITTSKIFWTRRLNEFPYSIGNINKLNPNTNLSFRAAGKLYQQKWEPVLEVKSWMSRKSFISYLLSFKYHLKYVNDIFQGDAKLIIIKPYFDNSDPLLALYSQEHNNNNYIPLIADNPNKITVSSKHINLNNECLKTLLKMSEAYANIGIYKPTGYGGFILDSGSGLTSYSSKLYLISICDFIRLVCTIGQN